MLDRVFAEDTADFLIIPPLYPLKWSGSTILVRPACGVANRVRRCGKECRKLRALQFGGSLLVDRIKVARNSVEMRGNYDALAAAIEQSRSSALAAVPSFAPKWLPD